ncbi:MAG: hypothetical protein ACFFDN_48875 [Candidatus Hodarchaeota archaeon]
MKVLKLFTLFLSLFVIFLSCELDKSDLKTISGGCLAKEGDLLQQSRDNLKKIIELANKNQTVNSLIELYTVLISDPTLIYNGRPQIQTILKSSIENDSLLNQFYSNSSYHINNALELPLFFTTKKFDNLSYETSLSHELLFKFYAANLNYLSEIASNEVDPNKKVGDMDIYELREMQNMIEKQMVLKIAIKEVFCEILDVMENRPIDSCARQQYWKFIENLQKQNIFISASLGAAEANSKRLMRLCENEKHKILKEIANRVKLTLNNSRK